MATETVGTMRFNNASELLEAIKVAVMFSGRPAEELQVCIIESEKSSRVQLVQEKLTDGSKVFNLSIAG